MEIIFFTGSPNGNPPSKVRKNRRKVPTTKADDVRKEISKMASSISEHSAAIDKLKVLPDQIGLILGLLTETPNITEEIPSDEQSDPIAALVNKSHNGIIIIFFTKKLKILSVSVIETLK